MACGIYKISFIGTDKVYIGQSNNCERRYLEHKSDAKLGKWAKKLQDAYTAYGNHFNFEILLECSQEELNDLEDLAILLYDSFNNGFNSTASSKDTPIYSTPGEQHVQSKHSNAQILQAIKLLIETNMSIKQVSDTTGVSYAVLRQISQGNAHFWIRDEYPEIWEKLVKLNGTRSKGVNSAKSKGIVLPNVISPEGLVYTVENIRAFAKAYGLDNGALGKVLHNKVTQHKGWKLA